MHIHKMEERLDVIINTIVDHCPTPAQKCQMNSLDIQMAEFQKCTEQRCRKIIKLTMEFMGIVPEGSWLEAHPQVKGVDGDLVHVMADMLTEDGALVARADAVFRSLRRRKA